MKKHKLYKPDPLSDEEKDFIKRENAKDLILMLIVVVLGAACLTILFKLMESAIK